MPYLGVLKDKKINKILELLKGYFKTWHITENENERSLSIKDLKENNFFDSEIMYDYASIDEAYNGALKEIADEDDIVIVFGSSYTVAPILKKYLEKMNENLKKRILGVIIIIIVSIIILPMLFKGSGKPELKYSNIDSQNDIKFKYINKAKNLKIETKENNDF